MGEIFSRDELKQCNKEVFITLFLKLQEQMIEMNGKLDRMAEQLAVAQNHRYGRKSEKLDVIDGQLCFLTSMKQKHCSKTSMLWNR